MTCGRKIYFVIFCMIVLDQSLLLSLSKRPLLHDLPLPFFDTNVDKLRVEEYSKDLLLVSSDRKNASLSLCPTL